MKIEPPKLLLPRTGQTASNAAGDDGDLQAGNPRATRFVDNGNGTITDRATGLQWVSDPSDCGEAFYTGGSLVTMNWADALTACDALDYAGFADWRLPNIQELFSLFKAGVAAPAIDTAAFPNTQAGYYWASTAHGTSSAGYKHGFKYNNSYAFVSGALPVAGSYYVRPVRGGRLNG